MKNETETEIETISIVSQDKAMEFSIEKYATLIIKIWKRQMTVEIEQHYDKKINRLLWKKENNIHLGVMDEDTIKQVDFKKRNKIITDILKTNCCSRNLIKWINTCSIFPHKFLFIILKEDKGESQTKRPKNKDIDDDALDPPSKKLHTLYASRKNGEEDLDASTRVLH